MTQDASGGGARGRVLIIAGSDSGGGAGLQADLKTVTALGGYGATAVTAITVQNTLGVSHVHSVPTAIIAAQIEAVLSDIGADAIKIGMLASTAVATTVAQALDQAGWPVPVVLDPVMIAKGGAPLLADGAVEALVRELVPRAALVTPNAPEAERITGVTITGPNDMASAAATLLSLGARAVLLKGGHLAGDEVTDLLAVAGEEPVVWRSPRIYSRHTHGTGCTLASAVATGLAQGLALVPAVERARAYVHRAIATAPGFGAGHGPLNHAWPLTERA